MPRSTPSLERLSRELLRQNASVESSVEALAGQLSSACPRGTPAWQRVIDGGEFLLRGSKARSHRPSLRHRPAK